MATAMMVAPAPDSKKFGIVLSSDIARKHCGPASVPERITPAQKAYVRRYIHENLHFRTSGLAGGSLLRMVLKRAEHEEDETEDWRGSEGEDRVETHRL